jgi:hypothetical protein
MAAKACEIFKGLEAFPSSISEKGLGRVRIIHVCGGIKLLNFKTKCWARRFLLPK